MNLPFSHWLQKLASCPSRMDSGQQCFVWNLNQLGRFGGRESISIDFNPDGGTLVSGLFFKGRPNAILLAVISIVVFSLYGVIFSGSAPHVFQELREVIHPLVTQSDSTRAVDRIFCGLWIVASLLHSAKNTILRKVSTSVSEVGNNPGQILSTSTGFSRTSNKGLPHHDAVSSAVAYALPESVPTMMPTSVCNHDKFTESFTNQAN
jgi:hypothetical protein